MWKFNKIVSEGESGDGFVYVIEALNDETQEVTTFFKIFKQLPSNDVLMQHAQDYIDSFLNII